MTATEPRRASRFDVVRAASRNGRIRRVMIAYLVFNVSEWATWIALLVWAFERDGVKGSSIIALVQLIPAALIAPMAAQALTRLSRPRALLVGYVAQAATQMALGAALLTHAPYALIATVAAAYAVSMTLTRPAHNSLVPHLCDTTGELTASNAAGGMTESLATFMGPLISGVLVAVWAPGGLVLVMGIAGVVGVVAVAWGLGTPVPHDEALTDAAPAPLPDRAGIRDVLRNRSATVLVVMVAAEYALVGMMDILLVVLALDVLDMSAAGPGLLNSALGIGGLVGAAFTFTLIGRRRLAPALVLGALGAGVAFAVAGLVPSTVLVMALLAVSGGGKLFFDVTCRTFVQRLLPDRLLGAVFGLSESVMMAGLALGSIAAPLLVHLVGGRWAFVIAGSFLPVVVLVLARRLLRMDADSVVPTEIVAMLQAVPVLSLLPSRIVERLAIESTTVIEPSGTAIVTEGDTGRDFYIVATGTLDVHRGDDFIRTLGPGDWFGELALLRDEPRTATVTARQDVTLRRVDRNAFLASVGATPGSLQAVRQHGDSRYR